MTRDLAAGIDSSTQSCTAVLRSLDDGAIVAEARAPHPPTHPPVSEQDPRAWWDALLVCVGALRAHLSRVAAISVGGQGHGLVLLDEHDRPLRPAKLWNDTEPAPDARRLRERVPPARWAAETGSVPGPALTVAKLAWTERVHPGLVRRARRIMLPFDYLIYRLSGRAVGERGGASGTGYFDPFANRWRPELAAAAAAALDWPAVLPEIIGSGARAGPVGSSAELGELAGAVVGAGSGDNMAAALGLAIRPGDTVVSLGTSGTLYGLSADGVRDPSGAINGYADATGAFLPMITTLNAAKVTDTFRRLLGVGFTEFDALALSAPPGSGGLVLVPYLDGERTPDRPDASGLLHGLRTGTGRAELARATVEGVLCGLLDGGDRLRAHGVSDAGRLILTGGAGRSRAFCQILADLTGREVWTSSLPETAAAGAAVQATAALTGRPTADVAESWAPALRRTATPRADADAGKVRANYGEAAALAGERRRDGCGDGR